MGPATSSPLTLSFLLIYPQLKVYHMKRNQRLREEYVITCWANAAASIAAAARLLDWEWPDAPDPGPRMLFAYATLKICPFFSSVVPLVASRALVASSTYNAPSITFILYISQNFFKKQLFFIVQKWNVIPQSEGRDIASVVLGAHRKWIIINFSSFPHRTASRITTFYDCKGLLIGRE